MTFGLFSPYTGFSMNDIDWNNKFTGRKGVFIVLIHLSNGQ